MAAAAEAELDADAAAAEGVDTVGDALDDTLADASLVPENGNIDDGELAAQASTDVIEAVPQTQPESDVQDATMLLNGKVLSIGERRAAKLAERRAAREEWKRLGEEVKPDHLKVPACAYELIDRLVLPTRDEETAATRATPPRLLHGVLVPRSNVDPTVIRAFIHRMDGDHDDLVEPGELHALSVKQNLGITQEQIANLFERIIQKRPPGKRHNIGVNWLEISTEMKASRTWTTAVDINVTCDDGDAYTVSVERGTLEAWCYSAHEKYAAAYPGLEDPTDPNSFLASVLVASSPANGQLLQAEPKVQSLLKPPTDSSRSCRVFATTMIAGQRQTWGYASHPHRELWLQLMCASGLKPLQSLEELAAKRGAVGKSLQTTNAAKAATKSHVGKEGKVRVRDPKPKVCVREGQSPNVLMAAQQQLGDGYPWDEKRMHSEGHVNTCIVRKDAQASSSGSGLDSTSKQSVAMTFDARRKFMQVQAKQNRDSDEQRFIGTQKALARSQASLLGQAGATVANVGVTFRGPHGHLGFSQHHLTSSLNPSQLKYEKNLPHSWDGSHLDHTKEPPLKEDVKYSKLGPGEREKQFGTYFTKKDNQCAKVEGLNGTRDVNDSYVPWKIPEFRDDAPQRHGKYGRRVFDPQVRENPVGHSISGIDSKPMEEFTRQQELVHEFLDRSLPPNQTKHFENYHPPSEMPFRKEVPMC